MVFTLKEMFFRQIQKNIKTNYGINLNGFYFISRKFYHHENLKTNFSFLKYLHNNNSNECKSV